jgi:DnaJ-class molecular chaperone
MQKNTICNMKKIKNFINYMEEKEVLENKSPMICPDCDGSGYTKIKEKSKRTKDTCTRCKGTGLLYSKNDKK